MWIRVLALALVVPSAAATADTLAVDPATSRVRIHLDRAGLVKFLGHDHEIEAKVASGHVDLAGEPSRSSVHLAFESARLAIVPGTEPAGDVPNVEARMRGPEVLDAGAHPGISFDSTRVDERPPGERATPPPPAGTVALLVHGTLRLRGAAFAIEVPVDVRRDAEGLVATGEASLELRALGIEPPAVAGVVKVANRFKISFEVHCRSGDPTTPR
jgi:polyisoprenoid-binding protein YceI